MPRAALKKGDLVRLTKPGLAALWEGHRLTADHVLKIAEVVPWATYGRPAFSLQCGAEIYVLWAGYVKLLRRRVQDGPRKCRECDGDGWTYNDDGEREGECEVCGGLGVRERKTKGRTE